MLLNKSGREAHLSFASKEKVRPDLNVEVNWQSA